jgi:hypothetical protein
MTTHAFASTFPSSFPFFADSAPQAESEEAVYALVQTGPAVSSDEVESHLDAVEITVRWGTQVMAVAHLEKGRGYVLGEGGDFVLPDEVLGGSRLALVVSRGDTFFVDVPGEGERAIEPGRTIAIVLGAFTVDVTGVRAGKKIPMGFFASLAGGALGAIALSFLGHSAVLASMALFMPSISPDDAETIDRTQLLQMRSLLDASAEKEHERMKDETTAASEDVAGGGSKGGEPHKGEAGEAGTDKPVTTKGHMSFKGTDAAPALSRREERELAARFGMIGLMATSVKSDGPTSPWATTEHAGTEAENKIGRMFGADANDQMGYGLGLWGVGEGGGGKGAGIGLDGLGDLVGGGGDGPGKWGLGRGDKDGMGNGHGKVPGTHVAKAPIAREGTPSVNGRLPADAIQRVVRMNFGKFRLCYENALRTNPGLTGRVVTKFVIARDGSVAMAQDGGSDLPHQGAVSCIVRSFQNLSFPTPEHGQVMVSYPLTLTPGE